MRIAKHFVTVGARRVHYLRAGAGPVLVLLHASACSAKVLRPLLEVFATDFTAIAPDTPGFGLSDKLPVASPSVEDFADALAETLDALGIEHAAVHGRHTGASIAVEFAARHPGRCAMALTDGYPILSGAYDEARIAEYLRPIVPSFDGAHLIWLWFRYRDQHAFWPWNAQRLANRADADVPDLDFLHRGVIEFLEAGNDYRLGYAAPFHHDALGAFARLEVPVCFGTRPGDWLHQMVPLYPPGIWHEELPRDPRLAAERERAILRRHPARGRPPPAPAAAPIADRTTTDYVAVDGASLLVRSRTGPAPDRAPLLIVPHAPGSSALYEDLIAAVGAERPVHAADLPGHGESDPLPGDPQSVEAWAGAMLGVLDALGLGRVDLYGHNGGAAVAVEMARRARERFGTVVLDGPLVLDEAERARFATTYAPDVTPSWEGAHLLRAWHHLRDQELWWPWFVRRRAAARNHEPRIAASDLTVRVREALKQPRRYAPAWRAGFDYPLAERLTALAAPVAVMGAAEDLAAPLLGAARSARPGAPYREVADAAAARAAAIRALCGETPR